jgi:hypothetical protein
MATSANTTTCVFDATNMVGESLKLQRAMQQAALVGPTDSTVILGETGTGKGRFAEAIHAMSSRCYQALVKVNCAAMPRGLLESELFSHEHGAFTGAIAQRLGRFEAANERAVVLSTGSLLEAPLHELVATEEGAPAPVTLKDAERTHIRKTFREVDGVTTARNPTECATFHFVLQDAAVGISATRGEKCRAHGQVLTAQSRIELVLKLHSA